MVEAGASPAEVAAGWESLRGWVYGGPQPTVSSILATCELFGGPCRYDPDFVIPNMDDRVPPR